jgi:hypothetical protein
VRGSALVCQADQVLRDSTMADKGPDAQSRPAWHALLGPLPADAVPLRQPVAPAEVLASPTGWAVAGWEQLVLHLSAGTAGLRMILVVLDGDGALLSASDAVLFRMGLNAPPPPDYDAPAMIRQESVGGRFEPDGSFRGTRWYSVAVESGGDEEPEWESTRSEPSPDDVAGLRVLVAEMIRRQP